MTNHPDTQLHAFSTFLGLPPDTSTPPACGAAITRDYGNVPQTSRCAECDRLVAEHNARKAALSAKQENR